MYSQESKANLAITVKGLRNNKGVVLLALYTSAEGFPGQGENAVQRQAVVIINGKACAVFKNCAYGTYAVSIVHDENNNRKLDTGLFNIPVEGYGFSNDARGFAGPASFKDSAFQIQQKEMEITITAMY